MKARNQGMWHHQTTPSLKDVNGEHYGRGGRVKTLPQSLYLVSTFDRYTTALLLVQGESEHTLRNDAHTTCLLQVMCYRNLAEQCNGTHFLTQLGMRLLPGPA